MKQKIESHKSAGTFFREKEIWSYFIQILNGLTYLHYSGLMHRDLKPANIFLTKEGKIKLGDFNISKVCESSELADTLVGTPFYISPEIWNDQSYDNRTDIWSLGCILFELCQLKPPFTGGNLGEVRKNVLKGEYTSISSR